MSGNPVKFVATPDVGVPNAPPGNTKSVPATAADTVVVPVDLRIPEMATNVCGNADKLCDIDIIIFLV